MTLSCLLIIGSIAAAVYFVINIYLTWLTVSDYDSRGCQPPISWPEIIKVFLFGILTLGWELLRHVASILLRKLTRNWFWWFGMAE